MRNAKQAKALIGAFIVVLLMLAAGYYLSVGPQTAPIVADDRTDSDEQRPAGPATTLDQSTTGSVSETVPEEQ